MLGGNGSRGHWLFNFFLWMCQKKGVFVDFIAPVPLFPLFPLSPLERVHVDLHLLGLLRRRPIVEDVAVLLHGRPAGGDRAGAQSRAHDHGCQEACLHERRRLLAVVNEGADDEAVLRRGAVVSQNDVADRDARLAAAVATDAAVLHAPRVADEERAVAEHPLDAVELGRIVRVQLHLAQAFLERLCAAPLRANGSLRWALVLARHLVRAFAGVFWQKSGGDYGGDGRFNFSSASFHAVPWASHVTELKMGRWFTGRFRTSTGRWQHR